MVLKKLYGDLKNHTVAEFINKISQNHDELIKRVNELEILSVSYRYISDNFDKSTDYLTRAYFVNYLLYYIYDKLMPNESKAKQYADILNSDIIPNLPDGHKLKNKIFVTESKQGLAYTAVQSVSETIQSKFVKVNWDRLWVLRVLREFFAIGEVVHDSGYQAFIKELDKSSPVFKVLGCVFYIPDLFIEFYHILKHTISGSWMSKEEKNLNFFTRLRMQLVTRWPKIVNHSGWILVGALLWVVFAASAPAYPIILAGLYFFDILVASIKKKQIEHQYQRAIFNLQNLIDETPDGSEKLALIQQLHGLEKAKHAAISRTRLSVGTTILLFAGMTLTLAPKLLMAVGLAGGVASFALGPILPIIGCSFVLATCIGQYFIGNYLDKKTTRKHEVISAGAKIGLIACLAVGIVNPIIGIVGFACLHLADCGLTKYLNKREPKAKKTKLAVVENINPPDDVVVVDTAQPIPVPVQADSQEDLKQEIEPVPESKTETAQKSPSLSIPLTSRIESPITPQFKNSKNSGLYKLKLSSSAPPQNSFSSDDSSSGDEVIPYKLDSLPLPHSLPPPALQT